MFLEIAFTKHFPRPAAFFPAALIFAEEHLLSAAYVTPVQTVSSAKPATANLDRPFIVGPPSSVDAII
jgi:hypothetical protein